MFISWAFFAELSLPICTQLKKLIPWESSNRRARPNPNFCFVLFCLFLFCLKGKVRWEVSDSNRCWTVITNAYSMCFRPLNSYWENLGWPSPLEDRSTHWPAGGRRLPISPLLCLFINLNPSLGPEEPLLAPFEQPYLPFLWLVSECILQMLQSCSVAYFGVRLSEAWWEFFLEEWAES